MSNLQIICAGFTEMFKVPIKTRQELETQGLLGSGSGATASSKDQPIKITVNQLFELTYRVTMSPAEADVSLPSESDSVGRVVVKFLQGNTMSVPITQQSTVCDVQKAVAAQQSQPRKAIRLIYGGTTLTQEGDEDMELRERGIGPNDVISALIAKVDVQTGLTGMTLYIDNDLLDPSYDYDFTNINDGNTKHMRGGYQYKRPCGWRRFALRVLGVYGDDKWLNSKIGGDWPVSYHGIQLSDQPGNDTPNEQTRKIFGKGHYSSPSVDVAVKYGTEFTYQGVKYAMVLQNRVNPQTTRMIPQAETGDLDEYWITYNAEDIRAYSICVKKL